MCFNMNKNETFYSLESSYLLASSEVTLELCKAFLPRVNLVHCYTHKPSQTLDLKHKVNLKKTSETVIKGHHCS